MERKKEKRKTETEIERDWHIQCHPSSRYTPPFVCLRSKQQQQQQREKKIRKRGESPNVGV
jgi:hypothetical protein